MSSGFSDIYKFVTAAQTYEGENTVLLLQTARYLMKSWGQALKGKTLAPSVDYLKNYVNGNQTRQWDATPQGILRSFQAATAGKIALAYKHLEERMKTYSVEEATNLTGVELAKIAEMHGFMFLLQAAITSFSNAMKTVTPTLGTVLNDLLELYATDMAVRFIGNLLQFNDITPQDIEMLEKQLDSSLDKLRYNAIGLVDGFDIPDTVLQSTLLRIPFFKLSKIVGQSNKPVHIPGSLVSVEHRLPGDIF